MPVRELGDPRLQALFGSAEPGGPGIRPVVRLPRRGPPTWLIVTVAMAAALVLFLVLDARRTAPAEPSTAPRAADIAAFAPEPPPLYMPPAPSPSPVPAIVAPAPEPRPAAVPPPMPAPAIAPQPAYAIAPAPAPLSPPMQAPQPRVAGGPALVIDTTGAASQPVAGAAPGDVSSGVMALAGARAGRIRASSLANRSTTVAQGSVIPAVLETAFDSTHPGFARAIVSRDVRGFDGTRVLIPRGSRLVGEYRSDASPGQKRATISWTRLVRPDGVTIAIDSPAVDPLGRGGVRARVNTHFFQRLTGALLQSTVQLGGLLAPRSASSVVVVPPGGSGVAPAAQAGTIAPTLTVPAGTSVSVFVAQDLDFSGSSGGEGP